MFANVSIQLVSPASGDWECYLESGNWNLKFPFNWFPQRVGTVPSGSSVTSRKVSIQLVSPASGDRHPMPRLRLSISSFHSIGFPSEWGLENAVAFDATLTKFPFNWFPQRVGTPGTRND